MSDNNIKFNYKNLSPFKWFVLENFPFIEADFDALTEWQLLCKIGKEINKIINSQNIVGEQAETLTNSFIELQNYVNNYFDNLDVQEEINNKLNEMAENGTLLNILSNYTNLIKVYNTTTELINDLSVLDNQKIRTLGYYNSNDGGGADFLISNIHGTKPYITLNNGLFANIIDDKVNVCKLGAKGDGLQDDTQILQQAINFADFNKMPLFSPSNKVFLTSAPLTINDINIDFSDSIIKANDNFNIIYINYPENQNDNNFKNYSLIQNLILDCENSNSGIYIDYGRKKTFDNIKFLNIKKYGFYYNKGFEILLKNSHFFGNGTIATTGIETHQSDSRFQNIILIDCYTAINNNGLNYYDYVHAWIKTKNIVDGSTFMRCGANTAMVNQCYSDTNFYSFVLDGGFVQVNQTQILYADFIYLIAKQPYIFYFKNTENIDRYLSSITNSRLIGVSSDIKAIFSNIEGAIKVNNNNVFWVIGYNGGLKEELTSNTPTLNIINQEMIIKNGIAIINILFTIDTTQQDVFSFDIPNFAFRPTLPIETLCLFGDSQYLLYKTGYTYIGSNINGRIIDDNKGVKYVSIHTTYPIANEHTP